MASYEQIAKLPKWAQAHIKDLEGQLLEAQRAQQQLRGIDKTAIEWCDYTTDARMSIPDYAVVSFATRHGVIQVNLRDDVIDVTAVSPRVQLAVAPRATNRLLINVMDAEWGDVMTKTPSTIRIFYTDEPRKYFDGVVVAENNGYYKVMDDRTPWYIPRQHVTQKDGMWVTTAAYLYYSEPKQ